MVNPLIVDVQVAGGAAQGLGQAWLWRRTGVRSKTRDSLGLGARFRELETLINRYLVQEDVTTEHWSGQRRIGITPSGAAHSYAYVVMPRADTAAKALPLDVADWGRAYPKLRTELEIFAQSDVTQYPYGVVDCPKWSVGRVAIIGDAAHGLPPTLGQGAGVTLMNFTCSHRLPTVDSRVGPNTRALPVLPGHPTRTASSTIIVTQ